MKDKIFDWVKAEENSYKITPVTVAEGYDWGMQKHITQCILYKDGIPTTGKDDWKPVKNIILPILNVSYRTEGFDVKDIEPYVDSADDYHKSFLVRKFHDKWALENHIDTFIDDVVVSYVDFGGVLVKNVKGVRPEVIPLQTIAFCDQTDILSGPFAIKHQYSVDQLKEKSDAWDKDAINEVVEMARSEKPAEQSYAGQKSKTPGKYIELYEVHGMFPKAWLTDGTDSYDEMDEDSYSRQIHIISYAKGKNDKNHGITLFRGPEKDGLFKVLRRDKRFGTALGRSAIEELFEDQVWVNYSLIQKQQMLEKAALMLGITDDPSFATKNKFSDLEKGEWLIKQPNTTVEAFQFPAQTSQLFDNFSVEMENHARTTGSANEAALGVTPPSGTPFKLEQLIVQEGRGMHEYRRGQIATFIEEIYTDWIIPYLVREMNSGQQFLASLSLDELEEVADSVVTNHVNDEIKKAVLKGQTPTPEQADALKQVSIESFKKGGTKRFLNILQDDLKSIPVSVKINVAGKQKNLEQYVDKLSNLVKQAMVNPQALQDPNIAKYINALQEGSGLSPIQFKTSPMVRPVQQQSPVASPVQKLPANV